MIEKDKFTDSEKKLIQTLQVFAKYYKSTLVGSIIVIILGATTIISGLLVHAYTHTAIGFLFCCMGLSILSMSITYNGLYKLFNKIMDK